MSLILKPNYGDPYYSNVSLLLHGDGTNGSTTITDNSSSPKTVTVAGNAQISTAQSKFGGASIFLDGNGDYVTVASTSFFNVGSNNFTVELWVHPTAAPSGTYAILFAKYTSGGSSNQPFYITLESNRTIRAGLNGTYQLQTTSTVSLNSWTHIAVTRFGDLFTIWLDGVNSATLTQSVTIVNPSINTTIGAFGLLASNYFTGYIDELRVTQGICRYNSAFTPPSAPFPDVTKQQSKLVLSKGFTPQSYMYQFPLIYPVWHPGLITTSLWLDAADLSTITTVSGAVSQWNDKSGNGRNVSQSTAANRPAYTPSSTNLGGRPCIRFDGINDVLTTTLNTGLSTSFTLVCVAVPVTANLIEGYIVSEVSSYSNYWAILGLGGSPGTRTNISLFDGTNNPGSLYATPSGASIIMMGIRDRSTTTLQYYEDATLRSSVTDTTTTTPAYSTLNIGAQTNVANRYANVLMAEVLVIPSSLSTTNREKLEGYLAHKWGLTASLPANHPYKTVGPTP